MMVRGSMASLLSRTSGLSEYPVGSVEKKEFLPRKRTLIGCVPDARFSAEKLRPRVKQVHCKRTLSMRE